MGVSMLRWSIAAFLSLVALASPTNASPHQGFWTGNALLDQCRATSADPSYFQKQSSCRSFIMGVDDAISMVMEIQSKEMYCSPLGVTAGQEKDIVIAYLEGHPGIRHNTAASIVTSALMGAFPCSK